MAIVNRTPDSFFDRGATFAAGRALRAVERAVAEGAEIIDIGGVKAGPGDEVDAAEEIRRTVATIAAVRAAFPDVVISIDTWRAEVAVEAVAAGADLLNDTWAGADPALARVAAATGAGLVCSHAGGLAPRTRPHRAAFDDVVADVVATVTGLAERAVGLGVRPDGILIDPAHDFGKNTRHSLEITRRLDELTAHRLAGAGGAVEQGLHRRDARPAGAPTGWRARSRPRRSRPGSAPGCSAPTRYGQTRRVLDMVASIRGDRRRRRPAAGWPDRRRHKLASVGRRTVPARQGSGPAQDAARQA